MISATKAKTQYRALIVPQSLGDKAGIVRKGLVTGEEGLDPSSPCLPDLRFGMAELLNPGAALGRHVQLPSPVYWNQVSQTYGTLSRCYGQ